MHDLAARGAPLEYWFFRTGADDLRLLVDLIVRRDVGTVETRVACTIGDAPSVSHDVRPMSAPRAAGVANSVSSIESHRTEGESGGVSWRLDVDLGRHRISPVNAALASTRPLDLLLLSRPAATFDGTVTARSRSCQLDQAPGMVAHYWGRGLAPSWCWVSVVGGPGEPRLEATLVRSRLWGSRATIKGGYVWAWSGREPDAPTLFAMPTNGSRISWSQGSDAATVEARRGQRDETFTAAADAGSFAPFGDDIRNSQLATVRWRGLELPGSLELR